MSAITALLTPSQRRTIRFSEPGPQLSLALTLLGITVGFGALLALNSYAAFGRLLAVALEVAPAALATDIEGQSGYFIITTSSLLLGYALAVVGVCAAFVHRLTGPTVALERQVRALKFGDYAARVSLRDGDSVHARLAHQLNALAEELQSEQRESVRRALAEVDAE